jgi:hypothetical protein
MISTLRVRVGGLGITSVSRTVSPVSGAGDSVGDAVGTVEADGAGLSEACGVVEGVGEQLTSTAANIAHATWARHGPRDEQMPFTAPTWSADPVAAASAESHESHGQWTRLDGTA